MRRMLKEIERLAGLTANLVALVLTLTLLADLAIGARYAVDLTYGISNLTEVPTINYIPVYVFAQPIYVPLPYSISLTQLATLFIALYAALLTMALFTKHPITDLKRILSGYTSNDAIETMKIMSITLLAIILIESVQTRVGIPTGELESPNEYIRYVSALVAPLIEEIGFRATIIGFIAIAIYLSRREAGPRLIEIIKILWRPISISNYGSGGAAVSILYIVMTGTAIFFGAAHYFSGGGWDIGKISTASIAGITLGYLYIRHGFHSAVIGHSFFNVYLLSMYYIEQQGGILSVIVDGIYTMVLGLSAIYLLYILVASINILSRPK